MGLTHPSQTKCFNERRSRRDDLPEPIHDFLSSMIASIPAMDDLCPVQDFCECYLR
jgi:hypothetical protein